VNRPGIAGDTIPREDGCRQDQTGILPRCGNERFEWRLSGHPGEPRGERLFGRLFYTPYWTVFELPPIDMKAASVGILDQIGAGLR
jgi:hypothetical protein